MCLLLPLLHAPKPNVSLPETPCCSLLLAPLARVVCLDKFPFRQASLAQQSVPQTQAPPLSKLLLLLLLLLLSILLLQMQTLLLVLRAQTLLLVLRMQALLLVLREQTLLLVLVHFGPGLGTHSPSTAPFNSTLQQHPSTAAFSSSWAC